MLYSLIINLIEKIFCIKGEKKIEYVNSNESFIIYFSDEE